MIDDSRPPPRASEPDAAWDVVPSQHMSSCMGDALGMQEGMRVTPSLRGLVRFICYRQQSGVIGSISNSCGLNTCSCRIWRRVMTSLPSDTKLPLVQPVWFSLAVGSPSHCRAGLGSVPAAAQPIPGHIEGSDGTSQWTRGLQPSAEVAEEPGPPASFDSRSWPTWPEAELMTSALFIGRSSVDAFQSTSWGPGAGSTQDGVSGRSCCWYRQSALGSGEGASACGL